MRPSLSVTLAVITWRPTARRGTVTDGPVPSLPATSDVQRMAAERTPSRKSTAFAVSVTGPATELLSAGERTVSIGGASVIVTSISCARIAPSLSVTMAVM